LKSTACAQACNIVKGVKLSTPRVLARDSDTKAAVLIFNRNADFTAVIAKIRETVPKHPLFKRDLGPTGDTAFRYIFAQPNDRNREIILTVLAFDIPTTRQATK
jgi:hypothetical protein